MPRRCAKTGKKTAFGNNRSHSMRSTRRKFKTNLVRKKVLQPDGSVKKMKVAASYLRTLAKRLQAGKKV